MPVIVVANPKGGVGKSTLATNIAGYLASQGHAVMLGDVDRQQSARTWLGVRPAGAATITPWEVARDNIVRPPKGTTHVVLDTPAALHNKRLDEIFRGFRFRPGTKPDGTPIRMKAQIAIDLP